MGNSLHRSAYYKGDSLKFDSSLKITRPMKPSIEIRVNNYLATQTNKKFILTDGLLKGIREKLKSEVKSSLFDVTTKPSITAINDLFSLLKKMDLLGLDEEDVPLAANIWGRAMLMSQLLIEEHELTFRKVPSSENYSRWFSLRVKIEDIFNYIYVKKHAQHKSMNFSAYTIKPGDWLSKIAWRVYGNKNLWDVIYEANSLDFHPDRIKIGQKIVLP